MGLAPARGNVLEQQMPSQLVEVTLVGGDMRIGLAFLERHRIDLNLCALDLGKHTSSDRPGIIHCMECLNVVTV